MIVDDSAFIRRHVAQSLFGAGYTVHEAANGALALQKLATTSDIGLVVCDVTMPTLDGFQFLYAHRHSRSAGVPVVMLTTEAHPAAMQRARALGASGWLVKPTELALLVATVDRLFGVAAESPPLTPG